MKKIILGIFCATLILSAVTGCKSQDKESTVVTTTNSSSAEPTEEISSNEEAELNVFIAASLADCMNEIAAEFNKIHPDTTIVFNADSSGTLQTQIQEGFECDMFISAGKKQMDALESDGLIVSNTRKDILKNTLVVIKRKDTESSVSGLENLEKAKSIAIAGGSVPAGKYTRQALISIGILEEVDDASSITTEEISKALEGVDISEQSNVSKVLMAVLEGSCEIGTVYYSDTYGYDDIEIIETVPTEQTGEILYPLSLIVNEQASEVQTNAAKSFYDFLFTDTAKRIFNNYYFETL